MRIGRWPGVSLSEASAGLREKMYRVLILMLLLVGLVGASPYFSDDKDNNATRRLLTGKVLDNRDNPLPGAVVHLTNTHTHAVKTYIARPDGTYRFPGLSFNFDYEVYAQFKGEISDTETVKKLDDHTRVNIVLRIDLK
jgi:hypothetical protein